MRWIVSLLLCGLVAFGSAHAAEPAKTVPIKAGIIGLDTSHVIAFAQAINDPKATGVLAEVEVVAAFPGGSRDIPSSWDRVPKYTADIQKFGVKIVPSIPELLAQVDAVLLESLDGRPHLEQARPVIATGKPLFIDKPMAASLADVIAIFRLAREANVPCFSASSLRFSSGFQAARAGKFGEVRRCTAWSPCSLEPHHPDFFWYGVHGVESLYTIMGPGCETVDRVGKEKAVGQWAGGRQGTFEGRKGYGAEVEGTKGKGSAGTYEGYKPLVMEICKFFKTRQAPVAEKETIELFAFMEGADESKRQGKPVRIADVLRKAEKEAEARLQKAK